MIAAPARAIAPRHPPSRLEVSKVGPDTMRPGDKAIPSRDPRNEAGTASIRVSTSRVSLDARKQRLNAPRDAQFAEAGAATENDYSVSSAKNDLAGGVHSN
jgi:hypothetical protein